MDLRCAPNQAPFPGTMLQRPGRLDPIQGQLSFRQDQLHGYTLHPTRLEFLSTGKHRAVHYRCWPLVEFPDRDPVGCSSFVLLGHLQDTRRL